MKSKSITTETRNLIARVRAYIAPTDQPQALYDLARTADGAPLVDAEMLRREAERGTMNDNPIEALRAVYEAATPGTWRHSLHGWYEVEAEPNTLVADCGSIGRAAEDARAIAATHNVMPELLAVVEAADDEPRTNEDGELTTLALALDALYAKIREAL